MSERELGHGPAPLPTTTAQLLAADGHPGGCTQMNSRIMLLVFFLRVNQFFQGRLAVDAGDRSLTSHCGTLEGRLPLPFRHFRFRPLQDLWLPIGTSVLWQSMFFFKFVSPILGLPSYQAWALAVKKFLSGPEVRGFFYLWSQGTVAPVTILFTEFFFLNIFLVTVQNFPLR